MNTPNGIDPRKVSSALLDWGVAFTGELARLGDTIADALKKSAENK